MSYILPESPEKSAVCRRMLRAAISCTSASCWSSVLPSLGRKASVSLTNCCAHDATAKTRLPAYWACWPFTAVRIWPARWSERCAIALSPGRQWSAFWRPRPNHARPWRALAIDARDQLDEVLRQTPLAPRPTADYQRLLEDTAQSDATDESEDNGPDDPTA